MTTTLSRSVIPGFAGEVEQFAAEQGMSDVLFAIYEVATRIFQAAKRVHVELYTDHEDSSWISVIFVIEGWPVTVDETQTLDEQWHRALSSLIPSGKVWSIGHSFEWME